MARQARSTRNIPSAQPARLSLEVLRRLAADALLPWGYELVDLEVAAGLIRVFIDWPAELERSITIDDCERVSRQLGQLLMVANLDYRRLEVSSPGLDRPLKTPRDFARFQGCQVRIRLRELLKGRRHWEGTLVPIDTLDAEFVASVPQASMPEASRPEASAPQASVPEASRLEASVSEASRLADLVAPAPGEGSNRWALLLNAGSSPPQRRSNAGSREAKAPGIAGKAPGSAGKASGRAGKASGRAGKAPGHNKGNAPGRKGKVPDGIGTEAPAGHAEAVAPMALCFRLDELESARLVPQLEF